MQFTVPDEKVEDLRQIVEAEFGELVTVDEARMMANNLLELHQLLGDLGSRTA